MEGHKKRKGEKKNYTLSIFLTLFNLLNIVFIKLYCHFYLKSFVGFESTTQQDPNSLECFGVSNGVGGSNRKIANYFCRVLKARALEYLIIYKCIIHVTKYIVVIKGTSRVSVLW